MQRLNAQPQGLTDRVPDTPTRADDALSTAKGLERDRFARFESQLDSDEHAPTRA